MLLFMLISRTHVLAQVNYNSKNTATVTGTTPGGVQVSDISNSGLIIDRLKGDQTPIIFPMIGLAKKLTSQTMKADGTYDIKYTLRVQNYSTIGLENVQIVDDLKLIFTDNANDAHFTIAPGAVTLVSSNPINDGTGSITVNSNFNGNTDKNLLVASSSLTSSASGTGYFATIEFTINVDTKGRSGAFKTYNNTARATATTVISVDAPTAATVSDVSHNDNDLRPNQGSNTNTPLFYNDPTPVTLAASDIEVTKTVSNSTPFENTNITFTIKVKNNGPGAAAPVVVTDELPAGYTYVSDNAAGAYISGTGVWSVGTLANGAEKTLTITATVKPDLAAAVYHNTASSNHPGDPTPANNSATVNVTPKKTIDLKITNTDGKTIYIPGTTNTYTIVVTNDGPRGVIGAVVKNTLPAGATGTWTAVFSGAATGTATGTGSIDELVNMPAGTTVTYTYEVTVPSGYTASFVNTATVALPALGGFEDPTPGNNSATDTDTKGANAVALAITKTSNAPVTNTYVPGTSVIYTVVATNTGPSDAINATIVDNMPTGTTGAWTAIYEDGAGGANSTTGTASGTGNINQTVTIPKGGKITYEVTLTIPSSRTGNLVNTATITKPTAATEADLSDNEATVTLTQDSRADLQITKTDSKTTFTPGETNTYTIVVTNAGPSDVIGATVTDVIPAGFEGRLRAVYSTNTNGTATGNATGTFAASTGINETVNMPSGTTITYTFEVKMPSNHIGILLPGGYTPVPVGHTATSKYFINDATVTVPAGVTDATPANNAASDADLIDLRADLSITNTDGKTEYVPGTNNVYTITVDNNGPSDVIGATIENALPAGVTVSSWTAVVSGGATIPISNGTGAINQLADIPRGGKIVYTVTMAIPSGRTVDVVSVATVTAPVGVTEIDTDNNTATDTDTTDKKADLKITNTDGKTQYTPGTSNTYTIVVTNDGPSDAVGARVTNTLPAGFTGTWTAVYAAGTAPGSVISTGATSGTGSISELVDMPTKSTVTYTFVVNVPSGYTGNYTNTATVTAPTGVTDPTPANNTADDMDTQYSIVDLEVKKVADSMDPIVNTNVKFTVSVKNVGPSDASLVEVTDLLKSGYTFVSAVPSVGTYDNTTGVWTVGSLVYNKTETLEITAKVVPNETAANYKNTATVIAGNVNDPVSTNNEVTIEPEPRQLIDLEMTKTVNNTKPEVGTEITFTLEIENKGPSHATNVVVNDKLKAGYTYMSSTPSVGTYNAGTGVWTIGNLNLNAKAQMLVRAIVNPNFGSADYENTAVASGTELEQILPNNTAKVNTVVPIPVSDLEIVKVASTATPSINTNVTFTLTATNKGLSDATGVTVTDLLTAGFKFVSANTAIGTYNPSTGIWSVGSLGVGNSVTLTINALVNETGPYINTATITGAELDHNLTNNTSTVVLNTQAIPVAVDDEVKVCATSPVVIDILANDVKSVSNIVPATVAITKQPTNGSVSVDPATGKATYTPRSGFTGNDQFSYTVKDANGGTSNEAVVKVTVNQAIVALNDFASTDPNLPVVIDILSNDIIGSAAVVPGSIIITQQPLHGTIAVDAAGKVTYTPNNNYVGTDSFKYTVKDASGCTSNVATVDIKMNDLPKIGLAKAATSVVKQQNGSYNITYHFVVGNYGTSILSNVSIKDDLRNTFKADEFSVKSITSLGTLRVNPQYNGNTNIELLATGNTLAVGDKQQVEIVVNIVVGSDKVTYLNSATAEGSSITGIKSTDVSTDGLVPDVNGDVSSSVPTPVDLSRPKQFIPEGFSPNGDGKNDTFVIANAGNKRISLEIYNRWANRVYRSADYKNDWSGQSNEGIRTSSELPEGTYFYIIVIDGKDKYVGSITLKR